MRYSIFSLLVLAAVCGIGFLRAEETSQGPGEQGGIISFSAEVAADGTAVSAVPGSANSYSTGTLRKGDLVEIFYKNKDGWCAIRPPEGCYSWINGNFVRPNRDGTGTIVSPNIDKEVPVRVGADSVLKSTSVQVGLKNGRTVTILGESTLTGGKKWYRIAPPAGEFRWIHESQLTADEMIAHIPDHLTREGDFSIASNSPVEFLPPSAVVPLQANGKSVSGNDAASGAFHLELARIYRDLFSTVEQSGSAETFELLADRASTLFNAAANDDERMEAQKLYQKIRAYRSGTLIPSGTYIPSGTAQEVASRTLYQYPIQPQANRLTPEQNPLAFTPKNQQVARVAPSGKTANQAKKEKKEKDKLKFAFADGRGPFSGLSRSGEKKDSELEIVPPANYQTQPRQLAAASLRSHSAGVPMIGAMVANNQLMVNNQTASQLAANSSAAQTVEKMAALDTPKPDTAPKTTEAAKPFVPTQTIPAPAMLPGPSPEVSEPSDALPLPLTEHPSSSAVPILADNPSAIRPVAGTESDSSASPVELWTAPKPLNEVPITQTDSAEGENFDAVGILGRFPDRPDGYPPYALVRNDGDRLVILSYITPEKGVNLDSYVGKKIGVNGSCGWFKKGEENRRLVTAKTVFDLGK